MARIAYYVTVMTRYQTRCYAVRIILLHYDTIDFPGTHILFLTMDSFFDKCHKHSHITNLIKQEKRIWKYSLLRFYELNFNLTPLLLWFTMQIHEYLNTIFLLVALEASNVTGFIQPAIKDKLGLLEQLFLCIMTRLNNF